MFADNYSVRKARHAYKFDMRQLKRAMLECGVSMKPENETAEALCDAILELLEQAIDKAYDEGSLSARWDD